MQSYIAQFYMIISFSLLNIYCMHIAHYFISLIIIAALEEAERGQFYRSIKSTVQ